MIEDEVDKLLQSIDLSKSDNTVMDLDMQAFFDQFSLGSSQFTCQTGQTNNKIALESVPLISKEQVNDMNKDADSVDEKEDEEDGEKDEDIDKSENTDESTDIFEL
jgi:hypothetical protein